MRAGLACGVALLCAVAAIAQDQRPPNILLITMEGLRADRVTETLMPTVQALGARGVRFERAYTHAPLTLPAHTSILTGLRPPSHGVRNNGFRLNDRVITLAEVLRDAGYRTGGFVGGSALDARFGLTQGFEQYDDQYDIVQSAAARIFKKGSRPAAGVVTAATVWIAQQREPWFAWTHLRAAHAAADPTVESQQSQIYDRGLASTDAALKGLFASLAEHGVLDRTLVILTADHGTSLGEHGERRHGLFAYEGVMHVPLIVAGPGVQPRVIRALASHADVMPTMLHLVGLTGAASDGQSLAPLMRDESVPERPVYFEALDAALMRGWAPLTGVVTSRWKFIDLPEPELYDLTADPGESTNRAASEPAVAARLRDDVIRLRTTSARAELSDVEPVARARLRSLGYLGSASWRLGASRVEDDPKRLLPLHRAYESAIETADARPAEALKQLESIVEQRPDFAAAVDAEGALLLAEGRPKDAIALLNQARAGGLRHRVIAERLAAALLAVKDARGAVVVLEPVIEADENAVDARFLLARAYSAVGKTEEAIAQVEHALRLDPTFAAASELRARLQKR